MSNRYKGGVISATAPATTTSKGIWTVAQQMQAAGSGVWPAVPGAPTSVTATAGNASASVTFTAPANTGYPTSLTYTVTSSPGSFTGTGSASPITVSGLTNGTAYTFTVTATNAAGTGAASAASNSVTPSSIPGAIGIAYGGGYFAGQINISGTVYNLVVADKSVGQTTNKVWGPYGVTTGFTSVINGAANSAGQAALGSTYEAATFCENLNTGGYTDWYLPALNEMEVLYYFLKPFTGDNVTGSSTDNPSGINGYNANAVSPEPISTGYTLTVPSQTTATAFQFGNAQAFDVARYWNSTEFSSSSGFQQGFDDGYQVGAAKSFTRRVRAIRKVVA